ncbi:MAG: glycosyltransferase, partial [Burkholderiales bacterium]|nr:glycosyltransferase [Burkholderiales bacterium]
MDARIESALHWAEENRLGDITLAIPYQVPDDLLRALVERRGVTSLIVVESNAPSLELDAVGFFKPIEYSWRLPQRAGARILYIGAGSRIAAPMLKACLRRGVREIGYWDIDRWVLRKTVLLAVDKVRGKLSSHLSTALLAFDRLRGKLLSHLGFRAEGSGGAALRMLRYVEGRHRRGFRRVVENAGTIERLQPVKGRVAFVCSTLVAGGAERQIVNTAVGLRRHGVDSVSVLVANLFSRPGNDFFLQPLLRAGIEVREVGGPVSSDTEWGEYQKAAAELHQFERAHALLLGLPKDLVQDILNLYSILREIRPEVVHSWLDYSNVRAGYAAVLAGVPRIVVSGRNVSPIHFPYILEPHMRAAYQGLATRPEIRFVNNSAEGAKDYAAWVGLPASRFRVIRNGIDISQTTRADQEAVAQFRCAHGVPAIGPVVGGMFRFSPEKRPLLWLQTAVELTARRPDVNCLLFGDGPLRPEMEQYLSACEACHRIR